MRYQTYTVYTEISTVCKFCGFRGQFQDSENLIRGNLQQLTAESSAVFTEHMFHVSTMATMSFSLSSCNMVIKDISDPPINEIVFCEHENRNPRDPYAVALLKDSITVGHIPCAISCICTLFLKRGDTLLGKLSLSF